MVLDQASEASLSILDAPQITTLLEKQCNSSVLTESYQGSGKITVPGSAQNPCGAGAWGCGSVWTWQCRVNAWT